MLILVRFLLKNQKNCIGVITFLGFLIAVSIFITNFEPPSQAVPLNHNRF